MQPYLVLRFLIVAAGFSLLAACGKPPTSNDYLNRGGPEALIDVSSEAVSLNTNSERDLQELSNWIEKDRPTRAELNCLAGDTYCIKAQKVLDLQAVPVVVGMAGDQTVTLIYERVLARDCSASYVDDRNNFYNIHHAAFGCATSANMVQQVTDKQSFINPNLSDDVSAVRAVNDMNRAYTPRPVVLPYAVDSSIVGKSKTAN